MLHVHHIIQRAIRPSDGPAFRPSGSTPRCEWDMSEKITYSISVSSSGVAAEHTLLCGSGGKRVSSADSSSFCRSVEIPLPDERSVSGARKGQSGFCCCVLFAWLPCALFYQQRSIVYHRCVSLPQRNHRWQHLAWRMHRCGRTGQLHVALDGGRGLVVC
jgi:hypothetical protein